MRSSLHRATSLNPKITRNEQDARYRPVVAATVPPFSLPTRYTSPSLGILGIDTVAGQLIARDATNGAISLSDDSGVTWQHFKAIPPNTSQANLMKVVRFGSLLYCLSIDSTDSKVGVYPATPVPATGTLSWGARVATCTATTSILNGKSTILNAGSSRMMLADYGDFSGGPRIQATADGTTWTTVWGPDPTVRHVHCIAEDPYHPGTWYATLGDNGTTKGVIRTTDNGVTWTTVVGPGTGNQWQAVQLSFDANYIYMAADHYGATAFYMDRATYTIRSLTSDWHAFVPVPGGQGNRVITDLGTTSGSTALTSASITAADKGRTIRTNNLPLYGAGSAESSGNATQWLTAAASGTANSTSNASATASGQTAVLGGDRFMNLAYLGAVDPATGVYYFVANDTSVSGNTIGIFYCAHPGDSCHLIDCGPLSANGGGLAYNGVGEVFVWNGRVWIGGANFQSFTLTT